MVKNNQIGIITHYDVHNHGALLQLTALIKILCQLGFKGNALTFDKNYDFIGHKLKSKYEVSLKSLGYYLQYILKNGLKCTYYNYKKRRTLNTYKKQCDLIGDFYSESPLLHTVIIGSDEVFALHTGPSPVFFGYCLPSDHIISYAGSFGPTTLEDIDKLHSRNFVQSGLKGLDSITVRDQNSADIVETLLGKRPSIVVDPVILYGFEDEIKNLTPQIFQKYLLIYSYDKRMNDPQEIYAIKTYAKQNGLKIISAGFFHKWCDQNVNVDPIQLLAWFKFATGIITDTFHGCIMSIITNSQFAVKTRPNNHLKLGNLLKEYNLTDRIFSKWEIDQIDNRFSSQIDYQKVNAEVERRRLLSLNTLKEMLD